MRDNVFLVSSIDDDAMKEGYPDKGLVKVDTICDGVYVMNCNRDIRRGKGRKWVPVETRYCSSDSV